MRKNQPHCLMCEMPADEVVMQQGICKSCRSEHGVKPWLEPLRPKTPCERCGNRRLVRAQLRQRASRGGDHTSHFLAPLPIGYEHEEHTTFFRSRTVYSLDMGKPYGELESYTCCRCGFVELYARNPEHIPIGDRYGTQLFEVGDEGSYRDSSG